MKQPISLLAEEMGYRISRRLSKRGGCDCTETRECSAHRRGKEAAARFIRIKQRKS